jgi:hypothetical protein
MKQSFTSYGVWSSIFRYIKDSKLLTVVDIIMSLIVTLVIIMCFVTMALAEDLVYDPATSPLESELIIGSYKLAFYPKGGSTHNNVWVRHDLNGYIVGGLNPMVTPGTSESSHNTVFVGSADPLTRITIGGLVEGGEASISGIRDALAVAIAANNRVFVSNAEIHGVYGGVADLPDSPGAVGYANDNLVRVENTTIDNSATDIRNAAAAYVNATMEYVQPYVKGDRTVVANRNTMYFANGLFQNLYGASVRLLFTASEGERHDVEASFNTVEVVDSSLVNMKAEGALGKAYGQIAGTYVSKQSPGDIKAHHNTVTLRGDTSVGEVWGTLLTLAPGAYSASDEVELYLGNTLNVVLPGEGGITVARTVANFQVFNFRFSAAASAGGGAVGLAAGDVIYLSDGYPNLPEEEPPIQPLAGPAPGAQDRAARVGSVDLEPDGGIPQDGTAYELMSAENGIIPGDFSQTEATGSMGPFIVLEYDLSLTARSLFATLRRSLAHPQLVDPGAAGGGSLAMVGQGSALAAERFLDPGLSFDDTDGGLALPGPSCPNPAFAASYGRNSYDDGGKLTLRGFNWAVGVGCRMGLPRGALSLGAFAEGGRADYESSHPAGGYPAISGDGESSYLGGGLAARMEFGPTRAGRPYLLAGARLGRARTSYLTTGFDPLAGGPLSLETEAAYRGASAGAGLLLQPGPDSALDLRLGFAWTGIDGDSAPTSAGEPIEFEGGDSKVASASLGLTGRLSGPLMARVGLGALHEFDGETRASVRGRRIRPSSLEGASGSIGLGLEFSPGVGHPFRAGLSFQGYAGRRRGQEASARLTYLF